MSGLRLEFLGDISGCDMERDIAADLSPVTGLVEVMIVDGQIQKTYAGHGNPWQKSSHGVKPAQPLCLTVDGVCNRVSRYDQ